MKDIRRGGFTLVELVLVVAILAFIATLAVGKFGDIRKAAARKTNLSNIANIQRAVNTQLALSDSVSGLFNYCESLVDANCADGPDNAGAWDEGGYKIPAGGSWTNGSYVPGIYAGVKASGGNMNAGGVSTGVDPDVDAAHAKNKGLKCEGSLIVRYLNTNEVARLNDAGVEILLYHNWLSGKSKVAQSSCGRTLDSDLATRNGGPGFRPDMSAFFPVRLKGGEPVAVVNPATTMGKNAYLSFGYDYPADTSSLGGPMDYFRVAGLPRLACFGLGRSSDATAKLFETPPRDNALDATYYRNYLLVFSVKNGTGNTGYTVKFEGVLDPEGNPSKQAQYDVDYGN